MNERLLMMLSNCQMVFTFLKALRMYFRHDRML